MTKVGDNFAGISTNKSQTPKKAVTNHKKSVLISVNSYALNPIAKCYVYLGEKTNDHPNLGKYWMKLPHYHIGNKED